MSGAQLGVSSAARGESGPCSEDELGVTDEEDEALGGSSEEPSSEDEPGAGLGPISRPGRGRHRPSEGSSKVRSRSSAEWAPGKAAPAGSQYNTVNDSWFINYNGIIVILPIIFNAFHDSNLERSYQHYSHGQRQKSLIIAHLLDLLLKLSLLATRLSIPPVVEAGLDESARVGAANSSALSGLDLWLQLGGRQLTWPGWVLLEAQLELMGAHLYLAGAFCAINSAIILACLCLPHRHLTKRLSCMALLTWLLMCLQTYLLYNNIEPDRTGALAVAELGGSTSKLEMVSVQATKTAVFGRNMPESFILNATNGRRRHMDTTRAS